MLPQLPPEGGSGAADLQTRQPSPSLSLSPPHILPHSCPSLRRGPKDQAPVHRGSRPGVWESLAQDWREPWERQGSSSLCAHASWAPSPPGARVDTRWGSAGSARWELPTLHMSPGVPLCPPGHSPVSMTLPHAPPPRPNPHYPNLCPRTPPRTPRSCQPTRRENRKGCAAAAM